VELCYRELSRTVQNITKRKTITCNCCVFLSNARLCSVR